jgi:methanogenic corrinoid protein MtbC1
MLGVGEGEAFSREHMDRILTDFPIRPIERTPLQDAARTGAESLAPRGREGYLVSSERAKLRRIIQGTVASMTAEKLAARYEMGLEHDRRYEAALAAFCAQIVRPSVRASALRDFLRHELPPGQPELTLVMFLEAAARQLGRKWVDGDCGFVDVTIGSARLQEIIRILSFEFRTHQPRARLPFVAILTPRGEQHTLAQHVLGLLFDAMGWSNVILEGKDLAGRDLRSAIEQADIVCIGWSNQRLKPEFQSLVGLIRSLGSSTRPPIVAGGIAALDSIDFLVSLGIDCICDSVYAASRICEKFYELETAGQTAQAPGRRAPVNAGGPDWLIR